LDTQHLLVVVNKIDCLRADEQALLREANPDVLFTSAREQIGIEQLLSTIANRMVPDPPPPGTPVPFTSRQIGTLETAVDLVERGKYADALAVLQGMLGR